MPSTQAQIIAGIMRRLDLKSLMSKNSQVKIKRNFQFEEPPASFYLKYPVNVYTIDGFKCVYTSSAKNDIPVCHMMYFHGGSYTMPAQRAHWHIVDSILSRVKAELTFVSYPLAPEYKCSNTIDMVYKAYKHIINNYSKDIILIGDSAGGGLALSLALYLNKRRSKIKPRKLVLLSPWLDLSMDNNITADLENRDLVLDKNVLKNAGQEYAGQMDIKNYLCSPLYGKLKNLGKMAVFIGTNDILYAQTEKLKQKMIKTKSKLSYYEYKDMHHVWMGYPIPEAKEAFDDIAKFLLE